MRWAFLALLLSCGTKPPPCDHTSCAVGCCDSRGLCVSGLSDSSCGERGSACEACPSSAVCQAGRCAAAAVDAGIQLGSACSQVGFFCFSASAALECKVGKWVGLPCRGPAGCVVDGGTTNCDMNGNVEGDACASSAERKGLCTSDGKATLECLDGTLKKTNTCRTCMVSGETVVCQP